MGSFGATEVLLILLVLVLLFGAKKLPELARGSGRALRIFKAETKGLMDDDDEKAPPAAQPPAIDVQQIHPPVQQPSTTEQPRQQPHSD